MRINSKVSYVIELMQILACTISFITAIIGSIAFYHSKEKLNFWLILSMLLCLLMLFFLVVRYWNRSNSRYESINAAFHKFNHQLRNELYQLNLLSKQGKLNRVILLACLKETGEFTVNLLGDLLSDITGTVVSVHIKTFPVDTQTPNSYRTLCICAKTDARRKTIKDHPISENTHFLNIVDGRVPHFFSENLAETIKDYKKRDQTFLITSEHWEKWFKSILVAPIRIDASLKGLNDEIKYDYLGFVCCDSLTAGAFKYKDKDAHLNLIKSFADGLYVYLDKIKEYLNDFKN